MLTDRWRGASGPIERFNGSFRKDVLDAYLFSSLGQVRILSEEWMEDYNHHRPHEASGNLPPVAYRQLAVNSGKLPAQKSALKFPAIHSLSINWQNCLIINEKFYPQSVRKRGSPHYIDMKYDE
jgi:hypothetical protein